MPRAFWKGAISFGMVVIPIRMFVATETKSISFHLLHKKDKARVKQVLHCPLDNEYFTSKETVKGYEYAKDQYVVLTESDFEKVPLKTSHNIDIIGFIKEDEIDPIYFYDAHYLQPEDTGIKPYILLREALKKTGRLGLAKVILQRREHLCALRPRDGLLVLHTIHYGPEIQPYDDLVPPQQEVGAAELEMASTLINTMVKTFKPEEYKDDYVTALQKLVEAKLQGEEVEAPRPPTVEIPDLMAALRASLESARERGKEVPAGASQAGHR